MLIDPTNSITRKRLGISLLALLVLLLYALVRSYFHIGIPCFFRLITGFLCPSCGISSMCTALLQGDIEQAYYLNKGLFYISPIILYILIQEWICWLNNAPFKNSKKWQISAIFCVIYLVIWGIYRNFL